MHLAEVDAEMERWQQGDAVLGVSIPFVCFAHIATPLSSAARELGGIVEAENGPVLDVLTDEIGFVVLSQTCDIVRAADTRHYVQLAPIVEVEPAGLVEIRSGRSPRYAEIPALSARRLVADLDRVMVVEKPLLAALPAAARLAGCPSDVDRRRFAGALARNHARFAFPDDFNIGMKRIAQQIVKRHDKDSPMGRFLAEAVDIRAYCLEWEAEAPEVSLLFVFNESAAIPTDAQTHIDALIDKFTPTGGFRKLIGQPVAYDTMTAARYRESDPLDFDYLSHPAERINPTGSER